MSQIETVEKWVDAHNARDTNAISELCAEDLLVRGSGSTMEGREVYLTNCRALFNGKQARSVEGEDVNFYCVNVAPEEFV